MDVVGSKALRTSFRPEMAVKSIQQAFFDNGLCGNGVNAVTGDDFSVDDLLDFSNEDVEQGFVEEEKEEEKAFVSVSVSSQERTQNDYSNSSTFSVKEDFGSVPSSELSVPTDDIAELEWLSHFVEDSFLEFSVPHPERNPTEKIKIKTENRCEPEIEEALHKTPCFLATIPVKARSKRSRTGGRVWFSRSALSESSSTSSSSSSSTSSLIFANSGQNPELLYHTGKTPAKKQKKKPVTDSGGSQTQRRCSHCHVQKTPQWRTGPLGAKTLCNACGVRYKSGRLLPEYRPACSPTFSSDIHSNNHRKVVEMRLKKEMMTGPETELTSAVQSF